jgi:hypothetical protein
MILVDQLTQPGVPCAPLPTCGGSGGHVAEPLQLGERPGPTGGKLRMLTLRQAPGRANQVRQARLPVRDPGLIHAIAITDQHACPVVNQGSEGFLGAARMDHVEGYAIAHHHPQPLEGVGEKPGCFVDVVDRSLTCLRRNRCIMRLDSVGDAVEHLLDGSQADGYLQHGGTKGLHHAPPIAVGPGQFPQQGTESGSVAHGLFSRQLGLPPAATLRTPVLMQHPVRHLHLNWGQFDHLMRIVRARHRKLSVPTRTRLGSHLAHDRRW